MYTNSKQRDLYKKNNISLHIYEQIPLLGLYPNRQHLPDDLQDMSNLQSPQ